MTTKLSVQILEYERQLNQLRQELATRQSRLKNLHDQKHDLESQLAGVIAGIRELEEDIGGSPLDPIQPEMIASHKPDLANATPLPRSAPRPKKKRKSGAKKLRHRRPGSLQTYILEVLKEQQTLISARDLADEVLKRGYQTSSAYFARVVQNTLSKMPEVQNKFGQGYFLRS